MKTVQITDLSTESGKNQEANKGGDPTESVVACTPYLMVQLHNVILTGRTRVVVKGGMVGVGTLQNIVHVMTAQTTGAYTRTGESPEA